MRGQALGRRKSKNRKILLRITIRERKSGRPTDRNRVCQLQDTKPYVEGFVDPELRLQTLDSAQVLAIDARVHELRFRAEPPELLFIVD